MVANGVGLNEQKKKKECAWWREVDMGREFKSHRGTGVKMCRAILEANGGDAMPTGTNIDDKNQNKVG